MTVVFLEHNKNTCNEIRDRGGVIGAQTHVICEASLRTLKAKIDTHSSHSHPYPSCFPGIHLPFICLIVSHQNHFSIVLAYWFTPKSKFNHFHKVSKPSLFQCPGCMYIVYRNISLYLTQIKPVLGGCTIALVCYRRSNLVH